MMRILLSIIIIVSANISCRKNYPKMNISEEFSKGSIKDLAQDISQIYQRSEFIGQNGSKIGDFLSRLWSYFGPPDEISYEGYVYCIKHKKSNITFLAICTGSGPGYAAENKNRKELYEIIKVFEKYLQNAKPADCEIRIKTDFGILKVGSHNGVPFEIEE